MEDNIIVLTDENGNEEQFEFLDLVTYEGKDYVVLMPAGEDTDEVVILQVDNVDTDDESFSDVEDDAVLDAVFAQFKAENIDNFDFAE